MKRTHGQTGPPPGYTIHEDSASLEKPQAKSQKMNGIATPSEVDFRPSGVRRQGSKFLRALRTLTNSGKSRSILFCKLLISLMNELKI